MLQNPLGFGFDLVIHSATKYLGGHSDLIAGAIAGARHVGRSSAADGHPPGRFDGPGAAFLLNRGLKTLAVRVERQCQTAMVGGPISGAASPGRAGPLSWPEVPSRSSRWRAGRCGVSGACWRLTSRAGLPAAAVLRPGAAVQTGGKPGRCRVSGRIAHLHDALPDEPRRAGSRWRWPGDGPRFRSVSRTRRTCLDDLRAGAGLMDSIL